MVFTSVGHLLRIKTEEWLMFSKTTKLLFDITPIEDNRIHYISKSTVREAVMTLDILKTEDGTMLSTFVIITTDVDPNLGKFQTISFIGPSIDVTDLERNFMTALN